MKKLNKTLIAAVVTMSTGYASSAYASHNLGDLAGYWDLDKSAKGKPASKSDKIPPITNLVFRMKIKGDTLHKRGTFFANQFYFNNLKDPGYIGLQPREDIVIGDRPLPLLHAAFSSFIAGSSSTDPNCHNGADGGPGISCAADFVGSYDHQYKLLVHKTADGTFSGEVLDPAENKTIHIGTWKIPSNQNLESDGVSFVEYYNFNPDKNIPNVCDVLPKVDVVFGPISSEHLANDTNLYTTYDSFDLTGDNIECKELFAKKIIPTTIKIGTKDIQTQSYEIIRGKVSN